MRWWNVKHPAAYAERLAAGASPAAGREVLGDAERRAEQVLLGVRLSDGLPVDELDDVGRAARRRPGRGRAGRRLGAVPTAGSCSPGGDGSSPTPWCVPCSGDPSGDVAGTFENVLVFGFSGQLMKRMLSG